MFMDIGKISYMPAIFVIGRPSSGKSSVTSLLVDKFNKQKFSPIGRAALIDADHLAEFSLMPDKGDFSINARTNRAKHLLKIVSWISSTGLVPVVAAIGQPSKVRTLWKESIPNYFEVYLNVDLKTCTDRDYKGTYKLNNVIGKDLPFEEPRTSDLILNACKYSAEEISTSIYSQIIKRFSS